MSTLMIWVIVFIVICSVLVILLIRSGRKENERQKILDEIVEKHLKDTK